MSDKIAFSPKHPLIWFAEYHTNIKELKIPKCENCKQLIKVKTYDDVQCLCGSKDMTWDNITINRFLLEFDENGEPTINYKYIPLDGLVKFGLLDPSTFVCYGIEMLTGYITVGDFRSGEEPFYIATGINTDTVPTNLVKVSDYICKGKAKVNLYHAKQATIHGNMRVSMVNFESIAQFEMDPDNLAIDNIAVGYSCEIPEWKFEVVIRVDCNNHLPYFTSKAGRIVV